MRRLIIGFLGTLLFLPLSALSAVASQEATPASALADLGLPALDIAITADAYEGIPDSLEAGRYLVTVTVAEDVGEFGGGVVFVQPVGISADEYVAIVTGELDPGPDAMAATPIASEMASPVAQENMPPPWVFDSIYAGGIFAGPGESAQLVLDLAPGEWVAWGEDSMAPWPPVVFEVTGEMPADVPEPQADATISMGEYVIEVTEGELVGGPQVIRIDNIGTQPHFILAARGPDGMTEEQIGTILDEEMQAEMTGTPPAYSGVNPEEDLEDAFITGTQSGGTSIWITVDLQPGPHVLVCFFPDMGDGIPHAYHGMYTVVEVGE